MDKIFIKNLAVRGIIGINPEERIHLQDIIINLAIYLDTKKAAETDDITNTVSYSAVAKKVRSHAETVQRFTVEALAEDLAKICLSEDGVTKTVVRVEKPRAIRFADSVGVEIEREKVPS